MSQHDMNVANGSGLTFRSDMNGALAALASQSSGAPEPSPIFPCQTWADTGTGRLKRRNSANTAWLDKGPLDSAGEIQVVASAALTDIGSATSKVISVSGTITITGLGVAAAGVTRTVRFLGSLLLTHNATSLILQSGANIITTANDTAEFLSLGGGNWLCLRYNLASGKSVAFAYDRSNSVGVVSQTSGVPTGAIIETGTNANGQYARFADGTQICVRSGLTGALSFTSSGSLFACNDFAGATAYPIAFLSGSTPSVSHGYAQVSGGWFGFLAQTSMPTNTAWPSAKGISISTVTTTVAWSMIAIGRWY